jgi:hypothetical protein
MTFSETQEQITETQLLVNTPPKSWPPIAKLQDYLRARCGCKFFALASAMLVQTVVNASIAHLNLARLRQHHIIMTSSMSSVAADAASACPHDEAQMVREEHTNEEFDVPISAEAEEEQLVDLKRASQGAAASDCLGAADEFDVAS